MSKILLCICYSRCLSFRRVREGQAAQSRRNCRNDFESDDDAARSHCRRQGAVHEKPARLRYEEKAHDFNEKAASLGGLTFSCMTKVH
jgi:hypothetical protein